MLQGHIAPSSEPLASAVATVHQKVVTVGPAQLLMESFSRTKFAGRFMHLLFLFLMARIQGKQDLEMAALCNSKSQRGLAVSGLSSNGVFAPVLGPSAPSSLSYHKAAE